MGRISICFYIASMCRVQHTVKHITVLGCKTTQTHWYLQHHVLKLPPQNPYKMCYFFNILFCKSLIPLPRPLLRLSTHHEKSVVPRNFRLHVKLIRLGNRGKDPAENMPLVSRLLIIRRTWHRSFHNPSNILLQLFEILRAVHVSVTIDVVHHIAALNQPVHHLD